MNIKTVKNKRAGLIDFSRGETISNMSFYSYVGTEEVDWLIAEVERLNAIIDERI